jgi:hypothetical protein
MRIVLVFVRLRWRLLRGAIRHGGTEQLGAVVSTLASAFVGLGGGIGLAIGGRSVEPRADFAIIACSVLVIAVLGFGVVAGVAQPIDPRVVAAEPLADRQRAGGLLAAAAFGPPGLAGIALGLGLGAGMLGNVVGLPVVILGVMSWLLALLLIARTATNLLALLTNRFPRAGQLVVGVAGLVFYGLFQFVPALLGGLDDDQRSRLAGTLQWSPPGQIGRGLATASSSPAQAALHVAAGAVWLPVLAYAFLRSARRLTVAVRVTGGLDSGDATASPTWRLVRRACGHGRSGAIAWRSIVIRFRTPRMALETFTGAGVGLAAVIVPTVLRDSPGSGAVLVGGAVQLAVLFMAGNSFGSDGPAVTHELLAGADAGTMARGKARSIAIVAAPLAVVGPLLAAVITDEWRYLVAGFGVGVGGLLAGSGAAVVQSALVPIAVPESDNPFASGESGKGIVAALLLAVVLTGLAVATVPVALALFWAADRGAAGLVTVLGGLTIVAGWAVMQVGIRIATARLRGRDPEFVASVTPAR